MFEQIMAVTRLNFDGLSSRKQSSLVIVTGMICVVAVLTSMLSYTFGLQRTFAASGNSMNAVVLSKSAPYEINSSIPQNSVPRIADAPGIAKGSGGAALIDAEALFAVPFKKKASGLDGYAVIRGVGVHAQEVLTEIKIVTGRTYRPGKRELIVGVGAQSEFNGTDVGENVLLPDGNWRIVGSFRTNGGILEGELIGDAVTSMAAERRTGFSSVVVRLDSAESYSKFKDAVTADPGLAINVERQSDYYERTANALSSFFTKMTFAIGGIMAIGALFGSLNTMYSSVKRRAQEIATLRSFGYNITPIVASIFLEAQMLVMIGAIVGEFMAWSTFDGQQRTFAGNVFRMSVAWPVLSVGLMWAAVIGFLGTIPPVLHSLRNSIARSIQSF